MHLRYLWLAAVVAASAGSAQALETRSISYRLDRGGGVVTTGTTTGRHTTAIGGGFASVDSGGTPVAYAIVHAHSSELTSNPNGYSEPSASVDFEYGYAGSLYCSAAAACAAAPSAPGSPFTISGYVASRVVDPGSFVNITIGDAYGASYYCFEGGADCGVHQFSFAPTLTGTITPGANGAYTVDYTGHLTLYIGALANTREINTPSGDAYGYVDPLIAFDPAVLAAGGFTAGPITLSDGVGNASAPPPAFGGTVPEPASWALLIAGFGLTGTALRRRLPVRAG